MTHLNDLLTPEDARLIEDKFMRLIKSEAHKDRTISVTSRTYNPSFESYCTGMISEFSIGGVLKLFNYGNRGFLFLGQSSAITKITDSRGETLYLNDAVTRNEIFSHDMGYDSALKRNKTFDEASEVMDDKKKQMLLHGVFHIDGKTIPLKVQRPVYAFTTK